MKELLWILLGGVSLFAIVTARAWATKLRWALVFGLLILVGGHYASDNGPLRAGLNLFLFIDRHHVVFVVLLALNVVGVIFAWRARWTRFGWGCGLIVGVVVNLLFVKSRAMSYGIDPGEGVFSAWDKALFFLMLALSVIGVILARRARLKPLGWVCGVMIVAVASGLFLSSIFYGMPEDFADIEDQFKYGSIGSDHFMARGIPYWIWKVLPEAFPPGQILPEGFRPTNGKKSYEAFGLVKEDNKKARLIGHEKDEAIDRPIGFSKRKVFGMDFIGINCAFCHVSTIRKDAHRERHIILGMPANTVDIELFFLFLFTAAEDKYFYDKVANMVTNEIWNLKPEQDMNRIKRFAYQVSYRLLLIPIYRCVLIPVTQMYARKLKKDFYFIDPDNPDRSPRFGPGRVDAWSPGKTTLLKPPLRVDYPGGIIDDPSLWNQKAREGMRLHWDGNIHVLKERNIIAGLVVNGPAIECLDTRRLERITNWIEGRPAPRLGDFHELNSEQAPGTSAPLRKGVSPSAVRNPQPVVDRYEVGNVKETKKGKAKGDTKKEEDIEVARLVKGKLIYERWCASCHAPEGDRIGRVEPLNELNTDPARMAAFTAELAAALNTIGTENWTLRNFRNQKGYVNMLLDGIWLRAPYLHNGSVPTLRHLLNIPCEGGKDDEPNCRPKTFYRGYDVYDTENVGFRSQAEAEEGDSEVTIEPGDTVEIEIGGNPVPNEVTDCPSRPSAGDGEPVAPKCQKGMVTVAGVEVNVWGLTAAQAEARVYEALVRKKSAQNPSVKVRITKKIPVRFFLFDTTLLGNSNQGHLYGTHLVDDDKNALIEFLKTL